MLTEEGRCFVWGSNKDRAIGIPTEEDYVTEPTELVFPGLESDDFISTLATGTGTHKLFVSKNGKCFSYGGNDYGQLGNGTVEKVFIPTAFDIPTLAPDDPVISAEVGDFYSVILSKSGRIFVSGCNENGQLGLGDQINRVNWLELNIASLAKNDSIHSIHCGRAHTVAVTAQGQCYVWGKNDAGQLGLGDINSRFEPTKLVLPQLASDDSIAKISVGGNHNLLLSKKGVLLVWGENTEGQLGLGNTKNKLSPEVLNIPSELSEEKIASISAGFSHTVIQTSLGQCYVSGNNTYGELGLADTEANQTFEFQANVEVNLSNDREIECLRRGLEPLTFSSLISGERVTIPINEYTAEVFRFNQGSCPYKDTLFRVTNYPGVKELGTAYDDYLRMKMNEQTNNVELPPNNVNRSFVKK